MKTINVQRAFGIGTILILFLSLCFGAGLMNVSAGGPPTDHGKPTDEATQAPVSTEIISTDTTDHGCTNNKTWNGSECVKNDNGPTQTPELSNNGTSEPCLTPGSNSNCDNGDHGQGNPTKAQANCNADQGEVDPSCPSPVPSTSPSHTPVPTGTTASTATLESTATIAPSDTPIPTGTTAPTATLEPTATATPTCPWLLSELGFCEEPSPTATATIAPSDTPTATATLESTATALLPSPTATVVIPPSPTATIVQSNTPVSKEKATGGFCLFETDVKVAVITHEDGTNDVYRIWLNGNHQITSKINLTWSLNGIKSSPAVYNCTVAFVNVDSAGQPDIYTVGTNGEGLRRVTNDATPETSLDWLRGQIVFTDAANNILHAIYADGSGNVMLTAGTNAVAFPNGYLAYAYGGTVWLGDEGGMYKNTNIAGSPVAWTYQGLVITNNGTLSVYDFTNNTATTMTGLDFVNQPNLTTINGLGSDNTLLNWFDPNGLITNANQPDWYRLDSKLSNAVKSFFTSLK